MYYKKVRADVSAIKKTTPSMDNSAASGATRGRGGVNTWVLFLAFIPVVGVLASIAIPTFISYRDMAYDSLAQTCLEEAVAAQEAYFGMNMEYASHAEDLPGVNDAGCGREGVSLHIYTAGSETCFMDSVHEKGKATFVTFDPTSEIAKLNMKMETFPSKRGAFQIAAPDNWIEFPGLYDDVDLAVGAVSEDFLVIGFTESRDNVTGMDAAQYSELGRAPLMRTFHDPEIQRTEIRSIAGYEAIQYRIIGVFKKKNRSITYLHTVLEGDDAFYQVVVWTDSRNFEAEENLINYIMMRFEEL